MNVSNGRVTASAKFTIFVFRFKFDRVPIPGLVTHQSTDLKRQFAARDSLECVRTRVDGPLYCHLKCISDKKSRHFQSTIARAHSQRVLHKQRLQFDYA